MAFCEVILARLHLMIELMNVWNNKGREKNEKQAKKTIFRTEGKECIVTAIKCKFLLNEESNSFYIWNEKLYSAFFGSTKQKSFSGQSWRLHSFAGSEFYYKRRWLPAKRVRCIRKIKMLWAPIKFHFVSSQLQLLHFFFAILCNMLSRRGFNFEI